MPDNTYCKGCRENVRMTPDEIDEKYVKPLKLQNKGVVSEEIYRYRLSVCMSCQGLEYKTTCRYCGCLVQIKARLISAKCSFPYQPKW